MSFPRGGLLAGASVMGVSASGVWAFLAARTLAGLIEYVVVTRVCERGFVSKLYSQLPASSGPKEQAYCCWPGLKKLC